MTQQQEQQQQQQQEESMKQQKQQQPLSFGSSSSSSSSSSQSETNSNSNSNNNVSEDTIYEYYLNQLYPALLSSLPILFKRISDDTVVVLVTTIRQFLYFISPKWNTISTSTAGSTIDNENNNKQFHYPELPSFLVEFWHNHGSNFTTTTNNGGGNIMKNPSTMFADYMIRKFDTNNDGHISINELADSITVPNQWSIPSSYYYTSSSSTTSTSNIIKETWSTWFAREWPLMDWKIGVLLWNTFGGLLLLIAILSIVPGRSHSICAKILRWPILGLTYFLVGVELMVYVCIRAFIRLAEDLIARPKHRTLRKQMSISKTYQEWLSYAVELDTSQKREKWLMETQDDYTSQRYNWGFIRELIRDMRRARSKKDSLLALAVIQQCTRKNVGGVMSEDLFSYSNTGQPKTIVTDFLNDLCLTLRWLTEEASHLPVLDDDVATYAGGNSNISVVNGTNFETVVLKDKDKNDYESVYKEQMNKENNAIFQSIIQATIGLVFNNNNNTNSTNNKPSSTDNSINNEVDTDSSPTTSFSDVEMKQKNRQKEKPQSNTQQLSRTDFLSAVHRREVLSFLKRARQAYGRTALCLSGGAMMGLYHFGHVMGLLENGLLPDIISGTSGGSVVGAIVCTRTDDELEHDLNPEVLIKYLKCFARPWKERIQSVLTNGCMFSFNDWIELIQWFTCGQTTFDEAFRKTGRIFCVTLSSTTKKAPPVLLNYLTAPNVTIASAVVASAAVPGFIPPVKLQYKDKQGNVRSQEGETYFDGSIQQDIPINGLAEMFNCQFFIACQCNPHIVPFFYNGRGGVGRPSRWSGGTQEDSWRGGFLLAALEMYLKNDMKSKFVFLNDLEAAIGFTSTMMTQEYEGSTTIVPRVSFWDYFKLISDPTLEDLYRSFQSGSIAAYEHIAMIKLHYNVADALDECIHKLDVGERKEAIFRRRHPKSIMFIKEPEKRAPRQALGFSPLRRQPSNPSNASSHNIRGGDSFSSQGDHDDEDEFERDWVTKGITKTVPNTKTAQLFR